MSNPAQSLPKPIQPELLAPFNIGMFLNTSFAVEPITDSSVAKVAESTTRGLVHLWVISAEGQPLTQADLDNTGIAVDDLARFVATKRDIIAAHFLPGRHGTLFYLEVCEVDTEGIVSVSFVLSEPGVYFPD
jgi:hypothetical protein